MVAAIGPECSTVVRVGLREDVTGHKPHAPKLRRHHHVFVKQGRAFCKALPKVCCREAVEAVSGSANAVRGYKRER